MDSGDFGDKGKEIPQANKNPEAGDCRTRDDDHEKLRESSSCLEKSSVLKKTATLKNQRKKLSSVLTLEPEELSACALPLEKKELKQQYEIDYYLLNDSMWDSMSSDDETETLFQEEPMKPKVDLSHIRSYPEFSTFFDDEPIQPLRTIKTLNMGKDDLNNMYEYKYSDYETEESDSADKESLAAGKEKTDLAMSRLKKPELQKALGNLRKWKRRCLRLSFRNPMTPWTRWANYVQPPKRETIFDKPQPWDIAPVSNLFNSIAVPKMKKPAKILEGWRRPVSLPYALDFEEIKHGKDCCCCKFINMEGITSADQFHDMYLERVTYNPEAHKLCMKERCLRCRDAVREIAERKERKEQKLLRAKTGAPAPKKKAFK